MLLKKQTSRPVALTGVFSFLNHHYCSRNYFPIYKSIQIKANDLSMVHHQQHISPHKPVATRSSISLDETNFWIPQLSHI